MELDGRPANAAELAALGLYNYGHFTSMLVADHRVRGLSLHLDRLVRDCRDLFDCDLDVDQVRGLVRRACGPSLTMVRVTIFAPNMELGAPGRVLVPEVLVTARRASQGQLPSVRLQLSRYERETPR